MKISVLLSIAWDLYIFLFILGFVQEKEKLYICLLLLLLLLLGWWWWWGGLLDCQSIRLVDMEGIGAYPLRVSERNRPAALCCVAPLSMLCKWRQERLASVVPLCPQCILVCVITRSSFPFHSWPTVSADNGSQLWKLDNFFCLSSRFVSSSIFSTEEVLEKLLTIGKCQFTRVTLTIETREWLIFLFL